MLFRQPWRTLASATLGGILGGVLRMYTRARPNTHVKHRASGLLISILAGVFVFVLYVVGVNVLPVNFLVQVGDIFVLAVSALGAWIGTAALKQFKAA